MHERLYCREQVDALPADARVVSTSVSEGKMSRLRHNLDFLRKTFLNFYLDVESKYYIFLEESSGV